MALKSTIYKAELTIADMDRHYYASHGLTLAQHPSETVERMMLRLTVFALHASDTLGFTKGISTDDEPDLWQKNYSEDIELWIELGEPDEKRLRKACGRAEQVVVYSYGGRAADIWWQQNAGKFERFGNLRVLSVEPATLTALAALCERGMSLSATIQDGALLLAGSADSAQFAPVILKSAAR
ncbi:MAG: YaeQ family protein [Paludibacterium sp.]|uniref:YaeQ family protein n=1 Tax=Paludibacterium sp. TaxID=1917523 RepID=UPI0025DBFB1E|nr:YaeQ family protein [Paludibacterium sp.]MBV8049361.1 YaeQ family protein [Paludibacterium sp.]MBV8646698.1 YaeQ family protein [Paludibacterium sp.]